MSTGPDNLYQLAQSLLSTIAAAFTADGITLPSRQYVTVGQPVAECDSLVVTYERIWLGVPSQGENVEQVRPSSSRVANLTAYIFRCGVPEPTGSGQALLQAPDPSVYNAYAALTMTDAYVMHRGVIRARLAGTFGDYISGLSVGAAEPLEPQGGIGGTRMTLMAELS